MSSPLPSEPSEKPSLPVSSESNPIHPRPRYILRNGRSWFRKSDLAPNQEPGSDMLIGIQAIAKFIGFSYSTTRKLIHQYGMPACVLGDNRYRIHPESLFRWMEAYSESFQEIRKQQRKPNVNR